MAATRGEPESVEAKVARTRLEQGLPPTVTDPVQLRRLASLIAVRTEQTEAA